MDIKEIEKLKKMNNKEIQKYLSDELNKAREPISFGYIRVSTTKQANDGNSLESQEKAVKEAGATEIYQDTYTGTSTDRPNFNELMKVLKAGDVLVVTKLDRMARSVSQGIKIIEELLNKGVVVNVLNLGKMDDSASGKLIRNIMLSFAKC